MRTFRAVASSLVPLALSLASQALGASVPNPVDTRIAAAEKRVKSTPDVPSLNELAFALCRKERDTGDPAVFAKADAVLRQSLALAPGRYETQKLQALLYANSERTQELLQLASDLNHKVPDDIVTWGLLVDGNIAVGDYAEAERDAQWILDLRAGSALGFEKAAALRELFGDEMGSIQFYDEALLRTSPNDTDQRAWYLLRKADLELASGNVHAAEEVANQALQIFPDSQQALRTLAAIRIAQGRYDEAAFLLQKRYETVRSTRNLFDWAEALTKTTHTEQSAVLFQQFETAAEAAPNPSLELIRFYLNEKNDPAKALAAAVKRSARFHDCMTLDALAWALFENGKYAEAKTQMDRALAVGVRRPSYFCHAAQLAAKLNDAAAEQHYRQALADFPHDSCPVPQVAASLERK